MPISVARSVHGEDLSVGDHVIISEMTAQFPSFLWCGLDATMCPPEQPIRITFKSCGQIEPIRIEAICLPFLLCRTIAKKHIVLDMRQIRFARVDSEFAAMVGRAKKSELKPERPTKKSKSRGKKSKKRKK